MNPAKHLAAVTADDHVREAVVAAETAFFAVLAEMDTPPPDQFFLYLHENFTRDDSFMAVFHIILWNKTVVGYNAFCGYERNYTYNEQPDKNAGNYNKNVVLFCAIYGGNMALFLLNHKHFRLTVSAEPQGAANRY
nr:hypothetical protein [Candidatus Contubernalis alkalaceticus]